MDLRAAVGLIHSIKTRFGFDVSRAADYIIAAPDLSKGPKKMHRHLCFALALLLTLVAVCGLANHARAADAPADGETKRTPAAKPADMHTEMEAMNRAIRTLNRSINDPRKIEASLAAVNELELHTVAAKGQIPKTAATQPAESRQQFIADFRKRMDEVLKTELELEQQVAAGQTAKAVETVKQLRKLEDAGHKKYQPPQEQ